MWFAWTHFLENVVPHLHPPTTPFSQPHGFKCEAGGIDVFVSGTPPPKQKNKKTQCVCTWCVFLSSAVLLVKRVLTCLSTLAHKQTQAGYWDSKYANIWRDLHRDQRTKLCCNDYIGIKTKLSINTLYRIKVVFCHKHNRNIEIYYRLPWSRQTGRVNQRNWQHRQHDPSKTSQTSNPQ